MFSVAIIRFSNKLTSSVLLLVIFRPKPGTGSQGLVTPDVGRLRLLYLQSQLLVISQ